MALARGQPFSLPCFLARAFLAVLGGLCDVVRHGGSLMRALTSFVALASLLVPTLALADPATPAHQPAKPAKPANAANAAKPARTARVQKSEPRACNKPPVEIVAGTESATLSLTRCDGKAAPLAVEQLSVLARPGG